MPAIVAGCSDPEPTPKIPDPTPTSSTPSPTDSETPDEETAEEFVRRWVDVNTKMQATGDASEYVALSSKCKPCRATADRVESIYADGGFVETQGWLVDRVIDRTGGGGSPVLDLEITSTPTKYRETAEGPTKELDGGQIVMRVRLNRGAPWQVVALTQVAS